MLSAVLVKWFICAFGKKLVHPTVLSPSDKLQPWPLHNVAAFTSVGLGLRCGCFIAINIAAVGRLSCWRQAQMMKKIAGIIGTSGDAPAMLVPAYSSANFSTANYDKTCQTEAFSDTKRRPCHMSLNPYLIKTRLYWRLSSPNTLNGSTCSFNYDGSFVFDGDILIHMSCPQPKSVE